MARNKIEVLVPFKVMERPKDISKAVASTDMQAEADFMPAEQPDLLFMRSILVSTGENKNDDVFIPEEMWAARSTPVLKPVDWEHNTGRELTSAELEQNPGKVVVDNQTIGVMYNTYTIDENGVAIDEAKASAKDFQIPQNFHIVDEAVIWKGLYPSVANRIEDGARNGTLFVSMEAWFTDYHYLVGNKIIARNEDTAFLDSSLRSNGGTGTYGGSKVGRVLRNITFGGKGIVARPANEPSVITHVSHQPISTQASTNQAIAKNIICDIKDMKAVQPRKETEMSDNASNNAEQKVSLDLYTQANSELVDLRAEAKNKDEQLATASQKVTDLEGKLENITSAFTKASELLDGALPGFASRVSEGNPENFFSVLSERLSEDKAAKAEIEKQLEEALAEITGIKEEARAAARSAKIDALLGVAEMHEEKDDDKKAAFLEKMKKKKDKMEAAVKDLSDEQFNALYEVWAEEKAEADEIKRGSLPVEGGSDMGRGAQDGHPHGASASETLEKQVEEVLARMVANSDQDGTSQAGLEEFKKQLTSQGSEDESQLLQDVVKALAGRQEPTDEENLSLILDKCVVASEQAPSAGEDAPQGVDLTQSYGGLVNLMLGNQDEE